jgi:hypothetical protein
MVLISKLGVLDMKHQQFQGEVVPTSDTLGIATQIVYHKCATNLKTHQTSTFRTKEHLKNLTYIYQQ